MNKNEFPLVIILDLFHLIYYFHKSIIAVFLTPEKR